MKSRTSLSLRLSPLSLAILLLAGCASAPPPTPAAAPKNRFSGTLADLENREIEVKQEQVLAQTAEEVLANYQTALKLFRDPAARLETLKRMADLTMESSQARDAEKGSSSAGGENKNSNE